MEEEDEDEDDLDDDRALLRLINRSNSATMLRARAPRSTLEATDVTMLGTVLTGGRAGSHLSVPNREGARESQYIDIISSALAFFMWRSSGFRDAGVVCVALVLRVARTLFLWH